VLAGLTQAVPALSFEYLPRALDHVQLCLARSPRLAGIASTGWANHPLAATLARRAELSPPACHRRSGARCVCPVRRLGGERHQRYDGEQFRRASIRRRARAIYDEELRGPATSTQSSGCGGWCRSSSWPATRSGRLGAATAFCWSCWAPAWAIRRRRLLRGVRGRGAGGCTSSRSEFLR
jgi:hypothetical protein